MATIRTNIVLNDLDDNSILVRRLANFAARVEDFAIHCSNTPVADDKTDCYIVSWNHVSTVLRPADRPCRWKPVVAFGPVTGIRDAYVDGCTDFLREPWTPEELYYRVRHCCRGRTAQFDWGEIEIERLVARISYKSSPNSTVQNHSVRLGPRQASLLDSLLALRGTVVTRDLLFYAMWERDGSNSRAVDMQIHSLRDLLGRVSERLGGDRFIRGIYGEGYMID